MTWNYRVVQFKDEIYGNWFSICEVFYNTHGKPNAHTAKGVRVGGESIDELREILIKMLQCLDKPIIEEMNETTSLPQS